MDCLVIAMIKIKHTVSVDPIQLLRKRALNGLKEATDFLEKELMEKVTIEDYDIQGLRDAGHPYSKRLPKDSATSPDEFINKQYGQLSENVKRTIIRFRGNKASSKIYISASDVPYIAHLINGTYKMRPRNPFHAVYIESMDKAIDIIKDHLKG